MVYGKAPGQAKMGFGDASVNVRLLNGLEGSIWEEVVKKAQKVKGRTGWGGDYKTKE
jgi:hypothetical protein